MNFFGHAAVACWRSTSAGFVLGAMVPDFTAMVRARPPRTTHAELSEGIAYHHLTDEVFHEAPTFRRLQAEAFEALTRHGVKRNAARAVAHVGVEILLDGELADDEAARDAYLEALGARPELLPHLDWPTEREGGAFDLLLQALEQRGLTRDHTTPDMLAFRVSRALAHRPRLALAPGEDALVRAWAAEAQDSVARSTRALLDELRARLLAR